MHKRNGSILWWGALVASGILLASSAAADTVTLPVAASVVGVAPFF